MIKFLLFALSPLVLATCERQETELPTAAEVTTGTIPADKVRVLNVGTFHMGYTPDANSTEFDENDRENVARVHAIAIDLAAFDPTVIVVEMMPQRQGELDSAYAAYLADPDMAITDPTEIELLAYEVGRLSGTERIYGIDHKLNYNYRIGQEIDNAIDSTTVAAYARNPFVDHPEYANFNDDSLTVRDRLRMMNEDPFLDFLITVNADILTYAGTDGNFEGADEAAKYYQRNLRMYSNLNRLDLTPDDRVFILTGASHAAFFRDFFSRSPKYRMVETLDYL
ncbi:DUF5694 domain-containing protein [Lewinella sp. IMCC34191]|uniref:DUF5694 domain-containing protein n=1 Tax=Lewinella sp. IMCC34191 TaxID=2259172 RepID=UPI000E23FEA6|nr:DUF5694 domain-containing protein [Lewinella sp. IMCC34191]